MFGFSPEPRSGNVRIRRVVLHVASLASFLHDGYRTDFFESYLKLLGRTCQDDDQLIGLDAIFRN